MRTQVSLDHVGALIEGRLGEPAAVLGPHEVGNDERRALAVRAFLPDSQQAWVLDPAHKVSHPMRRIHPAGLFEAICPVVDNEASRYQFRVADQQGSVETIHDPYSFPTMTTEYDLHLFAEGSHEQAYEFQGAHIRTVDGVTGVNFCVWAPNAQSVSIVGDFNGWDERRHAMTKSVPSGVWELFIPELRAGAIYKYRMVDANGRRVDKSDPYAFAAELPPCTASIVTDLNRFQWRDEDWLSRRAEQNPLEQPMSVYEVHLGSWRRQDDRVHGWMNYRELAHQLVDYCREMGFTHIELMPVSEHPFTGSWGYQTVGYFAATSRYGTPEDFMYFVNHCHENAIGVILDWVPAHFPRDEHGLAKFDGTSLYEHSDPRQGEHPDWGTLIFNYGRDEVRSFLISNALFWLDKYHIDGLRVDAVASMLYLDYSREDGGWIPNRYGGRENLEAITLLKQFNERAHASFPGVLTIAEESTSWGGVSHPTYCGGLGFSFKWNMGWMNDTRDYMQHDAIFRQHHHDELTFSLIYAFSENFMLPLSHDEVVHGKRSLLDQMPGDLWQKFANLRLLYSYMWTHPGKKLLFMGGELAQWNEWSHEGELQWDLLQWDTHAGIRRLVADLNSLYRREPALHQLDHDNEGFEWIDCLSREDSVLSYVRKSRDGQRLIVCCNFTPVPRYDFSIGTPHLGWHEEIFNSDSEHYGGSNLGNHPGAQSVEHEHHGRPFRINVNLPPLGVAVFKCG